MNRIHARGGSGRRDPVTAISWSMWQPIKSRIQGCVSERERKWGRGIKKLCCQAQRFCDSAWQFFHPSKIFRRAVLSIFNKIYKALPVHIPEVPFSRTLATGPTVDTGQRFIKWLPVRVITRPVFLLLYQCRGQFVIGLPTHHVPHSAILH